jgi:outer membrane lipoprotein SlyB
METRNTSNRIHPLIAAAAVSVMLVSLVGVAAITGVLPNSHSSAGPNANSVLVPAETLAAPPTAATIAPTVPLDPKVAANNVVNPPEKQAAAPVPPTQKTYAPRPAKITQSQPRTYEYSESVAQAPSICYSCGRVESVNAVRQAAQPSGVGVVAGAVLGGVLGNQVGGGNGKKIATVAGAVGGGYAGNEIEKRTRSTTAYQVRVRMEDGTIRTFPYNNQPNWNVGDRIRVVNGYLTARG